MKTCLTQKNTSTLLDLVMKISTDELIGSLRYMYYLMLNDCDQSVRSLQTSIIICHELEHRVGAEKAQNIEENVIRSMIEGPDDAQYEDIYHILLSNFHKIRAKAASQVEHNNSNPAFR